jgi:hypothetical protein
LERVSVDALQPGCALLLTHAHADSYGPLQRSTVYASAETRELLHNVARAPNFHELALRPGERYGVDARGRVFVAQRATDVAFVPFRTLHCWGSLGFYFERAQVLFVGDSRVAPSLVTELRTVVGGSGGVRYLVGDTLLRGTVERGLAWDANVAHVRAALHSLRSVCRELRLVCPHSSALDVLHSLPGECFSLDEAARWPKLDVLHLAARVVRAQRRCAAAQRSVLAPRCEPVDVCRSAPAAEYREFRATRSTRFDRLTLTLSCAWFAVHGKDPARVYVHAASAQARVFLSFHASAHESELLQRAFPSAWFGGTYSRPLLPAAV